MSFWQTRTDNEPYCHNQCLAVLKRFPQKFPITAMPLRLQASTAVVRNLLYARTLWGVFLDREKY